MNNPASPVSPTSRKSIISRVFAHKKLAALGVVVVLGGGYWAYGALTSTSTETKYVLGTVDKGTIVSTVSGSGQIAPSDQVDVKPKASGDVISVPVVQGQAVKAGQAIAYLDSSDAQKAVRDAAANLQSAQLSLQKLQQPATALSLTQAENKLANDQDALAKDYQSSYNDVVSAFLDLPDIMAGMKDITIGTAASHGSQWNIDYYKSNTIGYDQSASTYRDTAYASYTTAVASYEKTLAAYKLTSQSSDKATIENIANQTYQTSQAVGTMLKSMSSFIQFYEDTVKSNGQTPVSTADTSLSSVSGYITKMNSHISQLLADTTSIKTDEQAIAEDTASLANLKAGADAIDVQSSQLSITQRQNALQDAKDTLANYVVRAPFDGTIAKLDLNKGDSASSGSAAATLITANQIAELSLNEVDAAKVQTGQKVTMTFDAIDSLTLTGKVVSVDSLGTVSQGVVSYEVKIALDTQDARIKSGMTVNAAIQTTVHQDVLVVPSSAVKTKNGSSYVLVFNPELKDTGGISGVASSVAPSQVAVETGISDDTNIEITSGLTEGQQIVTRSVAATTAKTTTSSSATTRSATRATGLGGPPGGF